MLSNTVKNGIKPEIMKKMEKMGFGAFGLQIRYDWVFGSVITCCSAPVGLTVQGVRTPVLRFRGFVSNDIRLLS